MNIHFTPAVIQRIFWILYSVEAAASLGLVAWMVFSLSKGGNGPDGGAVGAWLVLVPPIVLAGLGLTVHVARSESVTMAVTVFLALPIVPLVLGPIQSAISNYQTTRSLAGDDDFRRPPHRNLAHAISAMNAAEVAQLVPLAGDVNATHGSETFLCFALFQAFLAANGRPPEAGKPGIEVIKVLLAAGADPNLASHQTNWPVGSAISHGIEMTEVLLDAGADPNRLDAAGRPVWWHAFDDVRNLDTLQLLLARGADLAVRHEEGGAVGWAAYRHNWRAVRLLVQKGAKLQGEKQFGQSVEDMLRQDLASRYPTGVDQSAELAELAALL